MEPDVILAYPPRRPYKQHSVENLKHVAEGNKICGACDTLLSLDLFNRRAASPDGYRPYCKPCDKARYYDKDETRIRGKLWRKKNPEAWKAITRREKSKPHQKLRKVMKRRIKDYLNATQTVGEWRDLVSCTPHELQTHLESQFTSSMSWDNYGTYWHIDHIIPCAAFDWSRPSHLKWCWHRNNLRPLPALENEIKGDWLSTGENASRLKQTDPERLNQVVGAELERLGIADASEFAASLADPIRITYVAV